jgi:hypothetical protein
MKGNFIAQPNEDTTSGPVEKKLYKNVLFKLRGGG